MEGGGHAQAGEWVVSRAAFPGPGLPRPQGGRSQHQNSTAVRTLGGEAQESGCHHVRAVPTGEQAESGKSSVVSATGEMKLPHRGRQGAITQAWGNTTCRKAWHHGQAQGASGLLLAGRYEASPAHPLQPASAAARR